MSTKHQPDPRSETARDGESSHPAILPSIVLGWALVVAACGTTGGGPAAIAHPQRTIAAETTPSVPSTSSLPAAETTTTAPLAPTTGTISIVAQEWAGLEGHQVLAAVVPGDVDHVRSMWRSIQRGFYFEPRFVGSVSWASVAGNPFSDESVVRNAVPFDWFSGRTAALENEAAQLTPGTYTIVLLGSGKPGPIPNWADDFMPFAPLVGFFEVGVEAGEVSRVVISDYPVRPTRILDRGPL